MHEKPYRFGVVGLGVIGGSLGQRLIRSSRGRPILGYDTDRATREAALRFDIDIAESIERMAEQAEYVVVAIPPGETADACNRLLRTDLKVLVSDVASVKGPIVDVVGLDPRFLATHPLAGNEGHGWASASPSLFRRAVWVATPTPATSVEPALPFFELANRVGARVLVLTPELHDRVVAYTSHLPQVLSTLAAGYAPSGLEDIAPVVSGGAFRDITRVAESESDLWIEIFRMNRHNVIEALGSFERELARFSRGIQTATDVPIRQLFDQGRAKRETTVLRRWREPTWHRASCDLFDFSVLLALGDGGFLVRKVSANHSRCELAFEVGVSEQRNGAFQQLTQTLAPSLRVYGRTS